MIGDYALLGDCHSAALVGRDGAIDWACFPRFDSTALFCRILDEARGGSFRLAGAGAARRAYLEGTNVLVTTWEGEGGVLEVTDCMPVGLLDERHATRVEARGSLLRRARCLSGRVEAELLFEPRFEYGAFVPRFARLDDGHAIVSGGADSLFVTATRPLSFERDRIRARWTLAAGEEAWIESAWSPSHAPRDAASAPDRAALERLLDDTIGFWRAWSGRIHYEGEYAAHVRRSALVLKALTWAPSGAIVAAPTTSLPEEIGGSRNWDYRYTWIRDATTSLASLFVLGLREEAAAFRTWIRRTGAGRPEDLRIMYGIDGRRLLPEVELPHLAGHRASAPVRIGNGAAGQLQLDLYGQLMQASWLWAKAGEEVTDTNWLYLSAMVERAIEAWRRPDQGIWEIRDEPRHFVHSKLYCWVAMDRALKLAKSRGLPAPFERWEAERAGVREWLLADATARGFFPQAGGSDAADASALLVPALGFLPTRDPLVAATLRRVREELEIGDGLLKRYVASDGVPGGEGAFLLCTFWLIDCLVHAGELDEAERLVTRVLGLANDVGLFAEEASSSGEPLGNFPQAFTHMALVTSCSHLSAARRGEIPADGACDYVELALDRLLARRGAPGRGR